MATIDRLDIQIEGSAQKANVAINDLIKNLDRLANSLKIDTSRLDKIGKSLNLSGFENTAKNIQAQMSNVSKSTESQMQKISKNATEAAKEFQDKFKNIDVKVDFSKPEAELRKFQRQAQTAENALSRIMASSSADKQINSIEKWSISLAQATNAVKILENHMAGMQTEQPKLDFNVTGLENSTKKISDFQKILNDSKNDMKTLESVYGGFSNLPKGTLDNQIETIKISLEQLKQSFPGATDLISAFEKEFQKLQGISAGLTKEPTRVNIETNSIDRASEKISELKNKFEKVGADFKFTGNFEQLNIEIEKVYSKLNELRIKEQEMVSSGQVNTSGFEQLQESLARVGNKFGIMQDLRDRTEAFNQSLKQLRVPEIREENLTKLKNALRKTEEEMEKLRTKLANQISMGNIIPNIDDRGFRKLTEQIALSEKQAEALRQRIKEVGGNTDGTEGKFQKLKESLTKVFTQSQKTSSSTNILGKNIKKLSSSMSGFSASAGKAVTGLKSFARQALSAMGVYLGIYGAIRGFRSAIDTFSDLTEVQNVVDVTFGDMAYKVEEFANNSIRQLGMSELSVKQYASRFQSMGVAMGIGSKNIEKANEFLNKQTDGYVGLSNSMADVSLNLTKLTADMASLYNVDQKVVAEKMSAVFTGQAKPLRDYGIDLTQATLQEWALKQGIDADIQSMSQAEKTMLRYQYVMVNLSLIHI